MAKPDIDDGWIRYAHELDAALAVAEFGVRERVILREVFVQIFNHRHRTAKLSPTAIGRVIGIDRGNIAHSIAGLVASNVLARSGDRYRLVKDYEKWTRGGVPMLSPEKVAYAKSAPSRAHEGMPRTKSPVVARDNTLSPVTTGGVVTRDNGMLSPVTTGALSPVTTGGVVTRDNGEVQPPAPPKEERASRDAAARASEDFPERQETKNRSTDRPVRAGGREDSFSSTLEQIGKLLPEPIVGRIAHERAKVERQIGGRLDCLVAAANELAAETVAIEKPVGWLIRVAKRIAAEGMPPEVEPIPAKPRLTPAAAKRARLIAAAQKQQREYDAYFAAKAAGKPDGGPNGS